MTNYRVTEQDKHDAVIAEFEARDQSEAEILARGLVSGKEIAVFGLWVQQDHGGWEAI